MSILTYAQLYAACESGGATAMSLVTELASAGGTHVALAPSPTAGGRGVHRPAAAQPQTRVVDDEAVQAVVIDDNTGQLRRVESAILQGIRDRDPLLAQVPRIEVSYGGKVSYTDLELPQRAFDERIRTGTVDGRPVTANAVYRAAREASPVNARILLELSPGSLVFGTAGGAADDDRWPGALSGEILGVLAARRARGGRRADDGRSGKSGGVGLLDGVARPKAGPVSLRGGAAIGASGPETVSCRRIIRTQVLNFATLRRLRFDSGPAGDAACRALLAAYALAGLARANAELVVRSGCDLVEAGPVVVRLDARNGAFTTLDPSSVVEADEVLAEALDNAKREADIYWRGQVLPVTGGGDAANSVRSAANAPALIGADTESGHRRFRPHLPTITRR